LGFSRGSNGVRGEKKMSEKDIFDTFLKAEQVFKDKEVIRPSYTPEKLPHRDQEITTLASIFVSALKGETPSNVFIYGKTGTGKTAVAKYVGKELIEKGKQLNKNLSFVYINCEIVDTEYGILSNIGNSIIKNWNEMIPFTGWPMEKVYDKLKEEIERQGGVTIIVLDEIDKLVSKSGDDVLYVLSRMNTDLEKAKASVIGISNDLKFTELLDARVKSSLGEEEMIFPPYNAAQLQDILKQRAGLAFNKDVLDPSVIPLCAALAAQEHGDARRALDLLRVSGEIAERDEQKKVTETHVRKAQNKIELDRVAEVIRTLPTQSKVVLMAILLNREIGQETLTTGDVYDTYKALSMKVNASILTQRRITDLISELDMLGIINARVISYGRGGRTREISASVPLKETKKVLEEDEMLKNLSNYKPLKQATLL